MHIFRQATSYKANVLPAPIVVLYSVDVFRPVRINGIIR